MSPAFITDAKLGMHLMRDFGLNKATLLGFAVFCSRDSIVCSLLRAGADPTRLNNVECKEAGAATTEQQSVGIVFVDEFC